MSCAETELLLLLLVTRAVSIAAQQEMIDLFSGYVKGGQTAEEQGIFLLHNRRCLMCAKYSCCEYDGGVRFVPYIQDGEVFELEYDGN